MDVRDVVYGVAPLLRKREIVVLGGDNDADWIQPLAASPDGTENGLIVRNLPATPIDTSLSGIAIDAALMGDNILVPGIAAQTIRAFKLFLVAASTVSFKFKDGVADLTPFMPLSQGGAMVLDFDTQPWFVTTAGNDFIIELSAAVQVSGRLAYQQS